jgi:ribonucleotide reductase alpha subunit
MNKIDNIITDDFTKQYKNKKVNWGFDGLGYIVYKRSYARVKPDGNTEEWYETIQRCINSLQRIGSGYSKSEAERLFDYVFNLKGCFSGRALWQLGTKLVDDLKLGDSLVNCWALSVSKIEDFEFILMESMLGGGVSPNISKEYTQELPRVKRGVRCVLKNTKDADFICPDSKEGWVKLWKSILDAYLITGKSFTYSTVCIRPEGEPIKTFGGIAPGPRPLIEGTKELCRILERREGKKLRTEDVADIVCVGGEMVKSGGVRRTALLLAGDPDDALFNGLKRWDVGVLPNYRSNSNNSYLCPKFSYLPYNYWESFDGKGEINGLINLPLMRKYGRLEEERINGLELANNEIIGVNPCIPAWTNLLTKNGLRKLKDINIGDDVWSKEGWTKVINKWSSGIKEVYEYRTTAGVFYGTENHRVVSEGEKIEAKDAQGIDIFSGEYSSDIIISPQDVTDGLVIGDGSVHKASNNLIVLFVGENDFDYFNSEIKDFVCSKNCGVDLLAHKVKTTITSDELARTYDRKIPDRFFYGDKNKICGFLRGLYSANGSVCGGRVTLKAASFRVIEQVQMMLSAIGIKSYFTTNKQSTVRFENGDYECKQSYDLNITSDRNKFFQSIGFIQAYKKEKLAKFINSVKKYRRPPKQCYDIFSVSLHSEEEVFDITVDNASHTFWNNCCDISNCGEATLENRESCNLSELAINNISSKEEMLDIAKLLYKGQKAISALNYYHEETNKVVHRNFKLGLSITGVCQRLDVIDEWADFTYRGLRDFDKEWSKKNNWPESIRLTVIQPSGTKGLLLGSSPGGHPGYAKYFIRRIRFDSNDPLLSLLKEHGYHIEPEIRFDGTLNHKLLVVSFPCSFSDNTLISKDCSAIRQLELIKLLQTKWADQSVSVTVYYKKDEIPQIKEWLSKNYDNSIKTVSFLLHSDHGFKQAPYEEIAQEKYLELKKQLKSFKKIENIQGDLLDGVECAGGICPVR